MYTTKYTLSYGRNIFIKVNGPLNQIQPVQEVYDRGTDEFYIDSPRFIYDL